MEEQFGIKNMKPTFTYTRDGKEVTVKMTMGLLNMLMQSVGNYNNVALVGLDPGFNDLVLRKFFTLRDHKGKPLPVERDGVTYTGREAELENLDEIDVSIEDMMNGLHFVQCHMVDFTMRALQRAGALNKDTEEAQKRLQTLATGLNGSLALASQNQSATPSA